MPGIEILNDWEKLKKQGLPALIVVLVWGIIELISAIGPKDPSCLQANRFLENQLDTAYKTIRSFTRQDQQKDAIIKNLIYEKQHTDSLLRVKTERPAKMILNQK